MIAGILLAALIAPTGLTVEPASPRTLRVSWTPVAGATAYRVQRDLAVGVCGGPDPVCHDSSVTCGRAYQYRVRACDNSGCYGWTQQVASTLACDETPPPTPGPIKKIEFLPGRCTRIVFNVPAVADVGGAGMRGYIWRRDGRSVGVGGSTSGPDLTWGASPDLVLPYRISVAAVDRNWNQSAFVATDWTPNCDGAGNTGEIPMTIIPITFADLDVWVYPTRAEVEQRVSEVAAWIASRSGGAATLAPTIRWAGTGADGASSWWRLPRTHDDYCGFTIASYWYDCNLSRIRWDIDQMIPGLPWDQERVVFVLYGVGTAGEAGGWWMSMSAHFATTKSWVHEFGHTMGLQHAGEINCGASETWWCDFSAASRGGCPGCRVLGYGDDYDPMGKGSLFEDYSGPHRELIGWPNEIQWVTEAGTYDLPPGVEIRLGPLVGGADYFYSLTRAAAGGVHVRVHVGWIDASRVEVYWLRTLAPGKCHRDGLHGTVVCATQQGVTIE